MTAGWVAAGLLGILAGYGVDRCYGSVLQPQGGAPARSGRVAASTARRLTTSCASAVTGILWAILTLKFGLTGTTFAEAVFVTGLVALATVDVRELRLPKRLLYPALVGTLAALLVTAGAAGGHWQRFGIAVACGAGSWLFFLALHVCRPSWLGFGDVRLALLLGLGIGWVNPRALLIAFLVANLTAAAVGLTLMAAGRATRTTPLPYGLFLAIGACVAVLAVHPTPL